MNKLFTFGEREWGNHNVNHARRPRNGIGGTLIGAGAVIIVITAISVKG